MSETGKKNHGPRAHRLALHRQPKRRARGKMQADINVTPLVDVVLVLLIIFMVVTPMLVRGVSVDLPVTSHHDTKNDDGKDIIVSITAKGEIFIDRTKITLDRIPEKIEAEKRKSPDKGVYIKADGRIRYGQAREVMEAIHKANIEDIQLGTEDNKSDGTSPKKGGG